MPVTVSEKQESRVTRTGPNASLDLVYLAFGSDDQDEVVAAVEAVAPAAYNDLVLLDVSLEPNGHERWEATAHYGYPQIPPFPATGESSYTFETGGGTEKRTHSIATIASYAPPGQIAPDYKGAIGVTENGVEGVDVVVPVFHFTEVHYIDDSVMTGAYQAAIFAATGKVNDAPFKGFAAGEVLFLGASGAKRGAAGDWEITFKFSALPNRTGITIGDITGIDKKGWEYLWVSFESTEDSMSSTLVKRPRSAHVEQVYGTRDFATLGIGT